MMGFRYLPYSNVSLSRIAVTNNLGFKRDEVLADQKVGRSEIGWILSMLVSVLVAATGWLVGGNAKRGVVNRKI